jgi:hypothetical protein
MIDMPAAAGSGRTPGGAEPGLIRRHDLMAALDRAAQKRVRSCTQRRPMRRSG